MHPHNMVHKGQCWIFSSAFRDASCNDIYHTVCTYIYHVQ